MEETEAYLDQMLKDVKENQAMLEKLNQKVEKAIEEMKGDGKDE